MRRSSGRFATKRREVDVALDLVDVLKKHLALRGEPRPKWLFTNPQGGIIRSNNFRDRAWKPLLQKAGIRYRTIHATRHTFATRLIMNGAKLLYVQKQLGHSSIQITVDLYTHWIKRAERERTLEVDRLLRSPAECDWGTGGGTRLIAPAEVIET